MTLQEHLVKSIHDLEVLRPGRMEVYKIEINNEEKFMCGVFSEDIMELYNTIPEKDKSFITRGIERFCRAVSRKRGGYVVEFEYWPGRRKVYPILINYTLYDLADYKKNITYYKTIAGHKICDINWKEFVEF